MHGWVGQARGGAMSGTLPRRLWLEGCRPDGEDTRLFDFSIDEPLERDLQAIPGQYFMLGVPGAGEAPFTFLETPDEAGGFRALIRCRGRLTSALFALSPRSLLTYRGPCGSGWPLLIGKRRVLLIAVGHDLTALASFVEEVHRLHLPHSLSLLHFTGACPSVVLSAAKERWRAVSGIHEVPGGEGGDGQSLLLVERMIEQERPQAVLCCASEAFTQQVAEMCLDKGLGPERIWVHVERALTAGGVLPAYLHSTGVDDCPFWNGPVHRYDRYRLLISGGGGHPPARPDEGKAP